MVLKMSLLQRCCYSKPVKGVYKGSSGFLSAMSYVLLRGKVSLMALVNHASIRKKMIY